MIIKVFNSEQGINKLSLKYGSINNNSLNLTASLKKAEQININNHVLNEIKKVYDDRQGLLNEK